MNKASVLLDTLVNLDVFMLMYHTHMLMFDEEDHAPPRTSPSAVED